MFLLLYNRMGLKGSGGFSAFLLGFFGWESREPGGDHRTGLQTSKCPGDSFHAHPRGEGLGFSGFWVSGV